MAYDLTPILEAIETIVNKKVSDAQYTKILTGKIKSQIQDNIYEVAFDNNSILAKTTGNIQLEVNDTVKLLQINGAENVNENTFILGKSEDLARAGFDINVGELKNIVSIAGPATTTSLSWAQEVNIDFNSADINKIKKVLIDQQLCCLKAKFKLTDAFKQDHDNGHYGLKLIIQYKTTTNVIKTIEEELDVVDMVGEPYKFFNEVEQQKVFKLNLYDLLEINSITLIAYTKDFGKSTSDTILEISDINFATVQYKEKGNEYTVELDGGSTRVGFVSKTQQDINTYTLLAQVKKNGNNFVNKNLVYYWFKKNPTIKVGNDLYCSYGGEGWACLNKSYIQSILAVGSTLGSDEKRKIWEDGGNRLVISEADTLQYHNYYKCVVVYNNDIVISSIEKDVINLDKNEVNIYFTVEPNQKSFTSKEQAFKLTCYPTGKSYSWYYLNDQNNKFQLTGNTNVLNLTGNDVNIDNYNYVTIVCEVTDIGEFIGQAARVFNNNLIEQYQEKVEYCSSADGEVQNINESDWQDTIDNTWYDKSPGYIFVKTTDQNNFSEISCYWDYRDDIGASDGVHHINGKYAKQTTAFNNMTKGGKERGIWFNTNNELLINANFIKTGALDATLITTGALVVGDLFKANVKNPEVTIGGFTVSSNALCWPKNNKPNTENEYVYLGQEGLKLGNKFSIDQKGNISWSSSNSPVKQMYNTINAEKPVKDSSGNWIWNGWHEIEQPTDIYFIQSSDGGESWAGPYLIQGKDGKGVSDIETKFYASSTNNPIWENVLESDWKDNPDKTTYSSVNKYLFIRQTITYTDGTSTIQGPYINAVWGNPGSPATITRDEIIGLLSQYPGQDGIYNLDGLVGINATAIKTGALLIGDANNPLFKAGWDKNADDTVSEIVTIGGFKVNSDRLYSGENENSTYVALSSSENNGYRIWAGKENPSKAPFSVKANGAIYSTSGIIGGWTIGENQLSSKKGAASNTTEFIINANALPKISTSKTLYYQQTYGKVRIFYYNTAYSAPYYGLTESLCLYKSLNDQVSDFALLQTNCKFLCQLTLDTIYSIDFIDDNLSQYNFITINETMTNIICYKTDTNNIKVLLENIDNKSTFYVDGGGGLFASKGKFSNNLQCNNNFSLIIHPEELTNTTDISAIFSNAFFIKDFNEKTLLAIAHNSCFRNIDNIQYKEIFSKLTKGNINILKQDICLDKSEIYSNIYYTNNNIDYYIRNNFSGNSIGRYSGYVFGTWKFPKNIDDTYVKITQYGTTHKPNISNSTCSLDNVGSGFSVVYGGILTFATETGSTLDLSSTTASAIGGYQIDSDGITFYVDNKLGTQSNWQICEASFLIFGSYSSSGSSS